MRTARKLLVVDRLSGSLVSAMIGPVHAGSDGAIAVAGVWAEPKLIPTSGASILIPCTKGGWRPLSIGCFRVPAVRS